MREKLTKKDVEKIEQEIEHRKLVVRKEAIEAVKEARAQGDLSENFEYYAAKRHKNQNESRIRYLENMLKTATIVSDKSSSDEVGMDDIVEVYFEEDDEIEKYKLVTSIRGNSMENRISIDSPIGMALKGHKIGDRVEVKVNDNYRALDVQLAGNAYYFGKLYEKPTIGDPIRPVEIEDIPRANKLLYATCIVGAILFFGLSVLLKTVL